ncbi:uncharacterized protein At5g50100, mitochondrial isoform X2 [Arabidopsis lyrata subsp. lyrata]|uniref:uncharacterized protein At5g50100, mitochondrial isoform X2 n=1 Tax=Arabidopsis lyrata subsp. lyrata TaxID=81972 RepID=UPI000A29E9F4|nr:uncharacterized protein At5g50100, mitochondrial isoform X2 [Arabidopsis lyrata subsp. lyrata]|eukprot:XP_020887497.1 uncharacterized protein At5g50100, mitochondrial isoform X2 [Arabidopsis lyrata subsp. lyrata]
MIKYQVRAIQGASVDPVVTPLKNREEPKPQNWKIKMLYDGDCPLCMREVNNMLKERNEKYGTIKFVDISPEDNQGLDYKTVMGQIHAIESDGNVVTGVEAFRRLYEEVGLGWVYTITKFEPGLDFFADEVSFMENTVQNQLTADNVSLLIVADDADKTEEPLRTLLATAGQKNIPIVTFATMVEIGEIIELGNASTKIVSLNKGKSYIGTVKNTLNQAEDAPKEERER